MSSIALGLGIHRGSRADTYYHIVTTFEAKESGVPGVLTQSLGISGRLEWLLEVCEVIDNVRGMATHQTQPKW